MGQIKKLLTSCITNLQKLRNSSGDHSQFVKGEVLQLEGAAKLLKQYLDDLQRPWPKKSKGIICNLCKRTLLMRKAKLITLRENTVTYTSVRMAAELQCWTFQVN